jgi:hypothetical protein
MVARMNTDLPKDAIELVAYTGMRIEETMVLKFSDTF